MEDTGQIVILMAIAALSFVSLSLAMVAFINVHRKKMLLLESEKQIAIFKAATESEEKEKEKIARNLHDQIVAKLGATVRSMDKQVKDMAVAGSNTSGLEKDLRSINDVIKEIREISHDLVPGTLINFGLIKALYYHLEQIGTLGESTTDFADNTGFSDGVPFELSDQLNIYRICLELLNNLYKHGKYTFLKLIIEAKTDGLEITFMHNGKGVTTEEIERQSELPGGLGLKSLKSRALILKAKIIYFVEDEIANVTLSIPYTK